MATKNSSGMDALKKVANNQKDNQEKNSATIKKQSKAEESKTETKTKRKVGRPKTKDIKNTCRNINVAVPITLLDKWDDIKIVHGSNLTEYITKLIEKDMNANYEQYKTILNNLNNI